MPFMYSEMQNKLSKTRESPLESMGQIISSRCPKELAFDLTTPTPIEDSNLAKEARTLYA